MKKSKLFATFILLSLSTFLRADFAPSSGAGIGVKISVNSGTGLLATNGEALLFTDPESSEFILLGDSNIFDAKGFYTWDKTGAHTGRLILYDLISGFTIIYEVTFSDQDNGSFSANVTGVGNQTGTFVFYHILKPSEVSDTLGLSQPIVRVDDGNVKVKLQIKSSTDLSTWNNQSGTVTDNTNGEITFSSPVPFGSKFFKIEVLESP